MTNMSLFSIYISNSLFIILISLAMFAKKQCSYVMIEEVDFYGSFYIVFVPERENSCWRVDCVKLYFILSK